MEHNQNPVIGQTVFLDTQIKIEADVWLWGSFKVVCRLFTHLYIVISCGSDFLVFVHITRCCVKRAVSMEKWSHRWCMWNEDHTQIHTIQNCVSWGAFILVVDGCCVKAAGAWSWQFNCSEEIKKAWSFSSTRSYDILVWTGAVLLSPLCNWLLLVTASLVSSWYCCVLPDNFQTRSQNCEKWH